MIESLKAAIAWSVTIAMGVGGWLTEQNLVAVVGLLVGAVTILERIFAIRLRRKQAMLADAKLNEICNQ